MVQTRYVHEIDDGNCVSWPDFFVDDCFYKVTTADNFAQNLESGLMWMDSKDMLRDRILSLLQANVYERHAYRHVLGLPLLGQDPSARLADTCTARAWAARTTRSSSSGSSSSTAATSTPCWRFRSDDRPSSRGDR